MMEQTGHVQLSVISYHKGAGLYKTAP